MLTNAGLEKPVRGTRARSLQPLLLHGCFKRTLVLGVLEAARLATSLLAAQAVLLVPATCREISAPRFSRRLSGKKKEKTTTALATIG